MLEIRKIDTEIIENLHARYDAFKDDYDIVGVFLYGSQNYNLATEMSDIDVYMLVNPSVGTLSESKNKRTETFHTVSGDVVVKDVRDFLRSLRGMGMNFLETLFTPYAVVADEYARTVDRLCRLAPRLIARDRGRMCMAMLGTAASALENARREIAQTPLESNPRAMKFLARAMHASGAARAVLNGRDFTAASALENARREIAQTPLESNPRAMKFLARAMHASGAARAVLNGRDFEAAVNAMTSMRYQAMNDLKNGRCPEGFEILPDLLEAECRRLRERVKEELRQEPDPGLDEELDALLKNGRCPEGFEILPDLLEAECRRLRERVKEELRQEPDPGLDEELDALCMEFLRSSRVMREQDRRECPKGLGTDEEETEWLAELQRDLIRDRKVETGNACPLYYGIFDVKTHVTSEGYEDRCVYYDADDCQEMSFEELMAHLEATGAMDGMLEEELLRRRKDGSYEVLDECEFNACLEESHGISILPVMDIGVVKPDCLFLTRDDAQRHLDDNRHHYTENAHTYAMTAWRSPRYEHLLELLHNIDFEQSRIVLKRGE